MTDGEYNPFSQYDFSGPLRPVYPLSPKREVPAHIPRPEYADDGRIKAFLYTLRGMQASHSLSFCVMAAKYKVSRIMNWQTKADRLGY